MSRERIIIAILGPSGLLCDIEVKKWVTVIATLGPSVVLKYININEIVSLLGKWGLRLTENTCQYRSQHSVLSAMIWIRIYLSKIGTVKIKIMLI